MSPSARGLRKLWFACYYLSQQSFDGQWHDRADHEAYRLLHDRMDELTGEAAEAAKRSVEALGSL